MAQRRMFSLQIVDTDAFLDMSQSAQLLYFHLAMRADDDGFVGNVKKITRMVGTNDDDLKILLAKNFIMPFESGVCVIKHWRIHNLIRSDRYNETKYVEEKALLSLKENGSYTMATTGIPNGNQMEPQVRLGKVSKGKDRLVEDSEDEVSAPLSIYGEFNNVKLKPEEYLKIVEQYGDNNANILIEELSSYIASSGKRYKSHYATLLSWARRKIQEHATKNKNFNNQKLTADFSK